MKSPWNFVLCVSLAMPAGAQTITRQNLAQILGFENGVAGAFPAGWSGSAGIFIDNQVAHSGRNSARIDRTSSSPSTFSTLTVAIPLDFAGKTIEWRGFVKTENVSDAVAIWLREDGDAPSLGFATSQGLGVKGTTDWKEYSITLPVINEAKQLYFGFLLIGTGRAWVDDLQLLVDGQPVANASVRIPTVFDGDHEFDAGSRVSLTNLTDIQIKNLAKLAKVWGFLKYHHPVVTGGKRHWDYDLFRILAPVLAAGDGEAANQAISGWIGGLGEVADCTTCAALKTSDLYLGTNLDWLADEELLGVGLSQTLRSIYRNRTPAAKTFYVSLSPGVLNPVFENELTYGSLKLPDAGYQLLSLFRFWNMVQYFYPNRDVMADDPANQPDYWDTVLQDSIPGIALAKTSLAFQQEMLKFIARIHDTHANLWSSIAARPPIGSCYLPVDVRFVEGRPVVLRYTSETAGPASGLKPGDAIDRLDGVAVDELVAQWRPIYADSNEAARLRDIGNYMTRGACGPASVSVLRGQDLISLTANRVPVSTLNFGATYTHDLAGDTFQLLSKDIGYLKLSSVVASKSASYIQSAAGTKGLIVDIRNYPSEFVVFTLGSLLVSEPTDFVRFTNGDVTNPGVFHWSSPLGLTPQQPRYGGKVVILVDEVTQSSAEYHAMAFRTSPGAIVIGSTTAGADGNVSTVPLPAGLSSYISGIGVYYPDNRPTQRVGIVPDIVVSPTIEGIRAGRDELIEEAIRQINASAAMSPR